jgi:hypothetical protein
LYIFTTNKNRSWPAFEKGRFNGLVGEGESLRQKLAFRAEFTENTKPAKNLYDLCIQKSA